LERSWKPTVAGVLAIIGGALNILVALSVSLFMPVAAPFRFALVSVGVIGVLFLATGIVALIGGIFALQRHHWGFALAGAICAMMPPATLLGIVGTVFMALAREEFDTGSTDRGKRSSELAAPPPDASSDAPCAPDTVLAQPSEGERNA
jgi:hypothetical protein